MKTNNILILVVLLFLSFSIKSQTLTIEITNIKNKKGKIAVAIFTNNKNFKKETPYIEKFYNKNNVCNGTLNIKLKLKPGIYGVSILDDENNDGKMKYNILGVPKEGFGFSDYYHTGIIKPKFNNFSFKIQNNNKKVIVKMKYM
ncbi:MAG: DUF2141 domain-containing protein [Bacteroidota bacterium]|nr:DUF2141 domain-containing protein [Bacteroidota bacterium]